MGTILKVGIAGVAAVALFLGLSGTSKAAESNAPIPPKEIQDRINAALGSADPHTIRIAAAQVEAGGFPIQADSMRRAAADIEAEIRGVTALNPSQVASLPLAGSGGKPIGTPIRTQADKDARTFAGKVALMLTGKVKGTENKDTVRRFQIQEQQRGVVIGSTDGMYGPKSALAFAYDHAIVPPKPLYWPKADTQGAKDAYRNELLGIANRDTARAEEWQAAAKV